MSNFEITVKNRSGRRRPRKIEVTYPHFGILIAAIVITFILVSSMLDALPETIVSVFTLLLIYFLIKAVIEIATAVWDAALTTGMIFFHPFFWLCGRRGFITTKKVSGSTTSLKLSCKDAFKLRNPKPKQP